MTDRESEIYEWIKENPLISQQEIADRAGITRSSVAVHISNLMKKGKIKGKGYVLSEDKYITVVGAVNMDISGTPTGKLREADSNPGHMNMTLGGVGRNIAENLARLGAKVSLITALGNDVYADEIEKSCRSLDIDISRSLKVNDMRTSTYLCINNAEGDMAVAVNDMGIYERLTPEFLDRQIQYINKGQLLIIDGNIPKESIEFLMRKVSVPVLAEPVSVAKSVRFAECLRGIKAIKPNAYELEALAGTEVKDDSSLLTAAKKLLGAGVENVVVSLGGDGLLLVNKDGEKKIKPYKCKAVNTTGCGDAMLAGIAYAMYEGKEMSEAVKYGLAASSICIEHDGAIAPEMLFENIVNRIDNNEK